MSGIYLNGTQAGYPSLLEVCRRAIPGATGWSGWEWRARSSGGFPSPGPMGVVVHHTASPARSTPGQQFSNDASYCAVGHQDAPVGNMVLGPEGQLSVHAAGAANTQGKGGPWTTSRGVVPLDGGNSRLLAIEASNDGQGQVWSPAQCQAYDALVSELAGAYGFRLDRWAQFSSDVLSHEEWCKPSTPGRKCDPAGPSPWSPRQSGGCSAGNLWSMDSFRASLGGGSGPSTTGDDDPMILWQDIRYLNVFTLNGPTCIGGYGLGAVASVRAEGHHYTQDIHDQTLAGLCRAIFGQTGTDAEVIQKAEAAGQLARNGNYDADLKRINDQNAAGKGGLVW